MIPVKQTLFRSEDGTVKGNCMSACIASMLELDIKDVPHFAEMPTGKWWDNLNDFLAIYGYKLEGIIETVEELKTFEGINGYSMVAGTSPRTNVDSGHAVVYKYDQFVWDPHPSGEGITQFEYAYKIVKQQQKFTNMIKISYNKELMEIKNSKGEVVFLGTSWDFHEGPQFLFEFLKKLNLDVEIDDKLE